MVAKRLGALTMGIAGILFVLYPAIRPWNDETTIAGMKGMASPAWIAAHLCGVAGFLMITLSLLALNAMLRGTAGAKLAGAALVTTLIGTVLTVIYFGAEIFALHAIGARVISDNNPALMEMIDAVRFNPAAITAFTIGLLLLAAGPILAVIAVAKSTVLPKWGALLFGIGMALYIPQFFGGAAIRIGHGVLLGIGCLIFAVAISRRTAK